MARAAGYLRQRTGSPYWWVRLQYPSEELRMVAEMVTGRPVRADESWSTKKANKTEAALIAGPAVEMHRKIMLAFDAFSDKDRHWGTLVRRKRMMKGTVAYPDGSRVIATDNEITYISAKGEITTRANDDVYELKIKDELVEPARREALDEHTRKTRPAPIDPDLTAIESYIKARKAENKMRKDDEDALHRTLKDFKSISSGRPINQCSRADAAALVDHLQEAYDLRWMRVKKLIALLKAAINYDMHDPRNTIYQYNVFANVPIPTNDDGDGDRPPFTEAEMKHIRENINLFSDEGALMYVWHASSSVRPGGLYSINQDFVEEGEDPVTGKTYYTRSIRIRKDKGKYGKRTLPIPQAVLDLGVLPDQIHGPIFRTSRPQLLVHIGTRLDKMGIEKPLYCARHRAKDRMMARGCNEDMRKAIMGHARLIEAHDIYGHGFPQWQVKPWLDKIGY